VVPRRLGLGEPIVPASSGPVAGWSAPPDQPPTHEAAPDRPTFEPVPEPSVTAPTLAARDITVSRAVDVPGVGQSDDGGGGGGGYTDWGPTGPERTAAPDVTPPGFTSTGFTSAGITSPVVASPLGAAPAASTPPTVQATRTTLAAPTAPATPTVPPAPTAPATPTVPATPTTLGEPAGAPSHPSGKGTVPTGSGGDGTSELPLSSVPVVARLLGDGPFGGLPAHRPAALPAQPAAAGEQPIAQRVRWERAESGRAVAQRVAEQPGQQPPPGPAVVELTSSAPTRLDVTGVNPVRVNPVRANPVRANPAGLAPAGIEADLPPVYPIVNRPQDTQVAPVQRQASAEILPVPVSYLVQRVEQAGGPTVVQAVPEQPSPAAPAAPTAPSAAAPAAPPGAEAEPEELLKKLFDPLLRQLKTELRLDRERYGALTDRA
jgi:hypothetical protein